jgi:hypothetical protein
LLVKFSLICAVNRLLSKNARNDSCDHAFLGSARVSRAGFGVTPKQAFLKRDF